MTNNPWELDILSTSSHELKDFCCVDLREPPLEPYSVIKQLLSSHWLDLPFFKIDLDHPPFEKKQKYLLVCRDGKLSSKLVCELRQHGYNDLYSVLNGFEAIRAKFVAT